MFVFSRKVDYFYGARSFAFEGGFVVSQTTYRVQFAGVDFPEDAAGVPAAAGRILSVDMDGAEIKMMF